MKKVIGILLAAYAGYAPQLAADPPQHTINVNCGSGQTITQALVHPAEKLTVSFKGTCSEDVLIDRDWVTLQGADGGATIVGGVRVDAAQHVVLTGFKVRDNTRLESGIEAVAGASIAIKGVTVENSANRGIRFQDSVGDVRDIVVRNSFTVGLLARGSRLVLEGTIDIAGSREGQITLTDTSHVYSTRGQITLSGGQFGMVVQSNAVFDGVFGSLSASGAQFSGIYVASGGTFTYALSLDASNNLFAGVWVDENATFSPFINPVLIGVRPTRLLNNAVVGAFVQRDSTFELNANSQVSGSTYGIYAEESTLRLTRSNVTGNATDLRMLFATKASGQGGNTIGRVVCDATVLTRGDIRCP
jgi:hypothetical protein